MDRVFGLFSQQREYIPYDEENDDGAYNGSASRAPGVHGPATEALPPEGLVVNFDSYDAKRRPAPVSVQDSWADPLGQIRQVSAPLQHRDSPNFHWALS